MSRTKAVLTVLLVWLLFFSIIWAAVNHPEVSVWVFAAGVIYAISVGLYKLARDGY